MATQQFNPNDIKHALRQHGHTMTSWAAANGFKFRDVSDVVRGLRHGNYGTGRDIAEKLAAFTKQKAA
jgi:gp16 family phage-associated protein